MRQYRGRKTAYPFKEEIFQALFDHTDVRPGRVVSLQTFGAYGANFNPHARALVSDGVFSAQGEFLPPQSRAASSDLGARSEMDSPFSQIVRTAKTMPWIESLSVLLPKV